MTLPPIPDSLDAIDSMVIAEFDADGELIYANAGMRRLTVDNTSHPWHVFAEPLLTTFTLPRRGTAVLFEGHLTVNGPGDRISALRGCIGHLEAVQPLVVDVAENAFAAAFRDPRFPALTAREWPDVEVHLSILTPAQPITFVDEPDLLAQLRPGEDGLILEDGPNRGTFLPSVWESLPDAGQFLTQLKRKAGLAANHWSEQLRIYRYGTESFGDADVA